MIFSFLDDDKEAKSLSLAPIEVKILVCRGSAHKILTDSGINGDKSQIFLLLKLIFELRSKRITDFFIRYKTEALSFKIDLIF